MTSRERPCPSTSMEYASATAGDSGGVDALFPDLIEIGVDAEELKWRCGGEITFFGGCIAAPAREVKAHRGAAKRPAPTARKASIQAW